MLKQNHKMLTGWKITWVHSWKIGIVFVIICIFGFRFVIDPFFFFSCRNTSVETCVPWAKSTTQQVDLAFNVFFMIYFFIRVRGIFFELVESCLLSFRFIYLIQKKIFISLYISFVPKNFGEIPRYVFKINWIRFWRLENVSPKIL